MKIALEYSEIYLTPNPLVIFTNKYWLLAFPYWSDAPIKFKNVMVSNQKHFIENPWCFRFFRRVFTDESNTENIFIENQILVDKFQLPP